MFFSPVLADKKVDWKEACSNWSVLGETIMKSRQAGVPFAKAMNALSGNKNEFVEEVIIKAYEIPQYKTREDQQRVITKFKKSIYLQCENAFKSREKS
jgi:hypothetical protein